MEDYIKDILEIFVSNSSESVGTMFAGVAIIVASGFFLPKIKLPNRITQVVVGIGYTVFIFGFFRVVGGWYDFSWLTWEVVFLTLLAVVIGYFLRQRLRALSYKLSCIATLDELDQFGNREPMITVENVGKEKVGCFCKVECLSVNGVEKSLHDINPYSRFLSWSYNKNLTTLYPNVPQSIDIAGGWGRKVSLSFSNQEFDTGHFHFSLGFYRKGKGDELIRFSEFEGGFTAEYLVKKDKMIFTWDEN